ncbi:MAG: hypothetical protein KF812_03780 [Fimbriimonadaceae bacterium]|nr:hypothetical protein [Fimbriimonadaceae bacterium]
MTFTLFAALALQQVLPVLATTPEPTEFELVAVQDSEPMRVPAWWFKVKSEPATVLDRPAFGRARRATSATDAELFTATVRWLKPEEQTRVAVQITEAARVEALAQEKPVTSQNETNPTVSRSADLKPRVESQTEPPAVPIPPTPPVAPVPTVREEPTTPASATSPLPAGAGQRSRLTPAQLFHRDPSFSADPYEKKVTVQVQDMDIATVLSTLSEEIDLNLVLQSASDKTLTLNLRETPFNEVLRTICNLTDLYSVRLPYMVVVGSKEALSARYPTEFALEYPTTQAETAVVMKREIVRLNFVDSIEAANVLRSQWKEEDLKIGIGPMHFSPGASDANVMGSGGILDSQGQQGGSAPPANVTDTTITGNPASKTLVLYGADTVIRQALALLTDLDKARPQVNVSVSILDVRNDKLDELGIKWDFGSFSLTENSPPGVGVMPFQRSGFNFQATISALVRDGAAKVLAEPTVGVMDGRSAYVLIGDKLKFPELVGRDSNNQPIFSTREERVGIYLQVAPTVSADGTVTMSIFPQVSTVTGYTDFQGIGRYPIISARESRSSVAVQNGDSIVIGGLIQEQDIKTWQEVPLLGRIPFFGELFRWRSNSRVSSQVIITITPRVVWPENHASGTID